MNINSRPNTQMNSQVKIISAEGNEFIVPTYLAIHSKTIADFLDPRRKFLQCKTMEVKLPITTKYLKRILEFMEFTDNQLHTLEKLEFPVLEEETNELLEIASYLRI